jgi:hypothetical protein
MKKLLTESEMSDEEIIDFLSHNGSRVNYELVKEYKEMEEEWGELTSSEDGSQYKLRMSEIVEKGRENVREIIYDDIYNRLENDLTEYLEELGYVSGHRDAFKNLPPWVHFSWEEFNDDEFDNLGKNLMMMNLIILKFGNYHHMKMLMRFI